MSDVLLFLTRPERSYMEQMTKCKPILKNILPQKARK